MAALTDRSLVLSHSLRRERELNLTYVDPPDREARTSSLPNQYWVMQFRQLSDSRVRCSSDIVVRCTLATMFEQLHQDDVAVLHWHAVLLFDPNHRNAQEGSARCRQRMGLLLEASR